MKQLDILKAYLGAEELAISTLERSDNNYRLAALISSKLYIIFCSYLREDTVRLCYNEVLSREIIDIVASFTKNMQICFMESA
jgi:hypothetical protein